MTEVRPKDEGTCAQVRWSGLRRAVCSTLVALAHLCLLSCSSPPACPGGSDPVDGRCIEDAGNEAGDADGDIGDSGGVDSPSGQDAAADSTALNDAGLADVGPDGEIDAGSDAGRPVFPEVVEHLSFAIRTDDRANSGSNGTNVSVCLNGTRCFPLNVPDVDEFRRGEFDVFHYGGVDLPRSAVDRVELRWESGTDAWQPACVEVRFDGEPVHCSGGLGVTIGNSAGESRTWRDPDGLHESCNTCYPARVTHGPMVGAVDAESARILVRTDATRPVRLEVEGAGGTVVIGPQYPRPQDDFATTFLIEGLAPRTNYTAHVTVGGARVGRAATFRTRPPAGASSTFRVGFGSCANDTNFPVQPVFRAIEDRNLSMFMFLGDAHYGNTHNAQAHWWRYRGVLDMPARARFLASTPTVGVWDDHDYSGNNGTRHAAGREAVLRAFKDYWPNPSFGTPDTPGVFFQTSHGDVDFFVLDVRYHRDRPDTGGSILGDEQAAWLEDALDRSTATFKVIASGSIFSGGGGETWRDYPASRTRLFSFLRRRNIGGVVLLAGDIHRSHFRWIHRSTEYDLPELVSSGLAVNDSGTCPGANAAEPDAAQVFCTQVAPTFMELAFDTTLANPRLIARIMNGEGGVVRSLTIRRADLE